MLLPFTASAQSEVLLVFLHLLAAGGPCFHKPPQRILHEQLFVREMQQRALTTNQPTPIFWGEFQTSSQLGYFVKGIQETLGGVCHNQGQSKTSKIS